MQYYDWGEYESWFWPSNAGGSGLYILIDNKKAIYVGKTIDLYSRLISHHVIDFEYIKKIIRGKAQLLFWPCEEPELSSGNSGYYRMNLTNTDRRLVDRFHEIVKVGKVRNKTYHKQPTWKPQFYWGVDDLDGVLSVIDLLFPYIIGDKRNKMLEAIAFISAKYEAA